MSSVTIREYQLSSTLTKLLFSFEQDMRVEKTFIQTLASRLSSTLMQLLFSFDQDMRVCKTLTQAVDCQLSLTFTLYCYAWSLRASHVINNLPLVQGSWPRLNLILDLPSPTFPAKRFFSLNNRTFITWGTCSGIFLRTGNRSPSSWFEDYIVHPCRFLLSQVIHK